MVDRSRAYSGMHADRFVHFNGHSFVVDYAALDKFLGELVAHEVAGELREQAARHRIYAAAAHRAADEHGGGLDRAYAQWCREEAEQLESRAAFLWGRNRR